MNIKTLTKLTRHKFIFMLSAFGISMLSALVLTNTSAFAATKTWDGDGADGKFSTATNWSDDATPINGDSIVLPLDVVMAGCDGSTTTDVELDNDLDPNAFTFAGISVSNSLPVGCVRKIIINGNSIKTSGDVVGGDTYNINLGLDVSLEVVADNLLIKNLSSTSGLIIGSHATDINNSNFSGSIVGSGSLSLSLSSWDYGCGTAVSNVFSGDGSGFSGSINLVTGPLLISTNANDFARHASSITTSNVAEIVFTLENNTDSTFNTPLSMAGGSITVNQLKDGSCATPTAVKVLDISDATFTSNVQVDLYYASLNFSGDLTGKEYLKLNDGQIGELILNDGTIVNSAMKFTTIDDVSDCSTIPHRIELNNAYIVNVDCSATFSDSLNPLVVCGVLGGSGTVGYTRIVAGGQLATSALDDPSSMEPTILESNDIEWQEDSQFTVGIGNGESDQVKVTGTVTLGDSMLDIVELNDFAPTVGDEYIIIDNDGTDVVDGIFSDLPEGTRFEIYGVLYEISYVGGDGNDVVLTVMDIDDNAGSGNGGVNGSTDADGKDVSEDAPGVPNTGFNLLKNNPVLTLLTTTSAATIIAAIAKRKLGLKI